LELPLRSNWGGRRAGAGRPPAPGRRRMPHHRRPEHRGEHPVHVTMRSLCRSLRTQFVFPTVREAIAAANRKEGTLFRVVEFSVQGDHVHLLVEARDRNALVEGMRGLSIRVARQVNRLLSRRGPFFSDRWHGRALTSPRAVRHALVYVLGNFRKHQPEARAPFDIYSSAPYFRGFAECPRGAPIDDTRWSLPRTLAAPDQPPMVAAKTWLLSTGWKRHGKLSLLERPVRQRNEASRTA
jgi:putative transposase